MATVRYNLGEHEHSDEKAGRRSRFMVLSKKRKIIIATIVLLALAGMVVVAIFSRSSDLPVVQTANVERRPLLESKVTSNGQVIPIQKINLTAEVSGRVTAVFVKEGDQIKKGTPLLKVDPTQLAAATSIQEAGLRAQQAEVQNQMATLNAAENAVNNAIAALNTAQADLERASAEQKNAEIEFKRNTDLLESGIKSRSEYDSAKMRFDAQTASVNAAAARVKQSEVQVRDSKIRVQQAQAALNVSKARVSQQQASLDRESDQLRKTTQFASINGVVVGPIIEVGTFAVANLQSTPLLLLADMSVINVEVWVDETDIANVAVGQKAKVKVDALGEIEIEGDVVEKAASAVNRSGQTIAQTTTQRSQEAKDFKVVIKLVNMKDDVRERLRPGMSATAVITTDRRENVIAVPLQALVERDPSQLKAATPGGKD
ncbi:MAG: efflux RND transporter periplasmic adaptor subunit, partial [Acidobacteria bacterium]|nr:efflux RND transporter periplasmic adaptor subunit [Acidobacteriota bacterium]